MARSIYNSVKHKIRKVKYTKQSVVLVFNLFVEMYLKFSSSYRQRGP